MTPTILDESQRLQAVHALHLLDTGSESEFDELVTLAAEICGTPISLVSLIDERRQFIKAAVGLVARDLDRSLSFCAHAIQQSGFFLIPDTTQDERFRDNALVTAADGVRFYAGIPLKSADHSVGTLCVIDTVPRTLSESQCRALTILAHQVEARFESRARQAQLENAVAANEHLTQTLTARNNLFRAFMKNGPFVAFIKDAEGRFLYYNAHMNENFDINGDAWLGKADADLWPENLAKTYREHDLAVIKGGVPVILEETSPGPGSTQTQWRSYKFPLNNEAGETLLAGISVNITSELAQQNELRAALKAATEAAASRDRSQTLFRTFLDNTPYHCYLKSEEGRYLYYNQKFADHFVIDRKKWLGRTDDDIVPPALAKQARAHDLLALAHPGVTETLGEFAGPDGTLATFKLLKFPCIAEDGSRLLACMAIDISGELHREQILHEAHEKLVQLAGSDALTGLANRRTFDARLAKLFATALADGTPLSLFILDVDNFKQLNDTFGHSAGDAALCALARILLEHCRPTDLVARIGGEEFAFILPATTTEQALARAEAILQQLRSTPVGPQTLTASIGISSANFTSPTIERLITRADDAMYVAKRSGKDRAVAHQSHIEALMKAMSKSHKIPGKQPPTKQP